MKTRAIAAALALSGLVAGIGLVAHQPQHLGRAGSPAVVAVTWVLFAVGAWLMLRLPGRTAAVLILLGGAALPVAAGFAPPRTSDDLYRYQWDGRVQADGINPYRYPPAAPELLHLRDRELWPGRSPWCIPPAATDPETGRPLAPGCTLINRPAVRTIYPPVAQGYFLAVHAISPSGARSRAIQMAAALSAIATTMLLFIALPRLGIDRRRAVLWAWCPMVALEAGNNAHVDVVAAFLTAAALVALARAGDACRSVAGGGLLGLAVATKLTPLLVLPAVIRRRPLAVLAAVTGAMAAVYLPHILAVGADVVGYLPGYLAEEGYADGSRFALLTLLLPEPAAGPAAVILLAAVALAMGRRADPDQPWPAAVATVGVALLLATPAYPWYAVLLAVLVALGGRPEWLAVAAAGYVALYAADLSISATLAQRLGYGLAAIAVAAAWARRRGPRQIMSAAESAVIRGRRRHNGRGGAARPDAHTPRASGDPMANPIRPSRRHA